MTSPLDQLNLRPQERRILVIVGLIIFVVLNVLLVTPLFGQLAQSELALDKSKRTLAKYEAEISKAKNYETIEARLKQEGGTVLSEELQLQRIVNNQAIATSVQVSRSDPVLRPQTGRTNQFFEDQGLRIDFTSGGKELVDFLVAMASANSMVHVHDMTLRPAAGGTRLGGNIVFVASYQKKNAPATSAIASGAAPRPTTKSTNVVAAAAKTNPPAAAPPKTNSPKTITTPPPSRVTNAAVKPLSTSKTISNNSAKPPKK